MKVLVTGAGGPLGVNFCRSLRKGDASLTLVGTDANPWHLPMSICDQNYQIPFARDLANYEQALCRIAAEEEIEVIVPTHPVEVRAVAKLRDEGKLSGMRCALPRSQVLEMCDDKGATHGRLKDAGLAVPQTLVLHSEEDLQAAFSVLRQGDEAIWVRGSGAPGLGIGGAALPCTKYSVAKAWIEHHQGWGKMAASEFLPGKNLTWMALFSQGELVAAAARERLEYVLPHVSPSGITGAPAVSRTIRNPEIEVLGEAAVRAVDEKAHGVFFVDFKGRADGQACVTEINGGRCGTTVHFYTEAGYNFPYALLRLAVEGQLKCEERPNELIEAGQYWLRTLDCGPVLVREADFAKYPRAGIEEV